MARTNTAFKVDCFVVGSLTTQGPGKHKIQQEIARRIRAHTGGRIHNLIVEVCDNTISIKGNCQTFYSKQMAQQAAMGVIEDERLCNQIEVAWP